MINEYQKSLVLAPASQNLVNELANCLAEEFADNDLALGTFAAAGEEALIAAAKAYNRDAGRPFLEVAYRQVRDNMEAVRVQLREASEETK